MCAVIEVQEFVITKKENFPIQYNAPIMAGHMILMES